MDRSSLRGKGLKLIGTALYGALRRVVWDPRANYSRGPDSHLIFVPLDGVAHVVEQAEAVIGKWRELLQTEPLLVSDDGAGAMLQMEIESRGIRVKRVAIDRCRLSEQSLFVVGSYAVVHSNHLADLHGGFSVDNRVADGESSERGGGLNHNLIGELIKASSAINRVIEFVDFKSVGSFCDHGGLCENSSANVKCAPTGAIEGMLKSN